MFPATLDDNPIGLDLDEDSPHPFDVKHEPPNGRIVVPFPKSA
ncbi:hypothetical protein QF000_006491 [Paraburkholderia atlantica]